MYSAILFIGLATLVFYVGTALSVRATLEPNPLLSFSVLAPITAALLINGLLVGAVQSLSFARGFIVPFIVVGLTLLVAMRRGANHVTSS